LRVRRRRGVDGERFNDRGDDRRPRVGGDRDGSASASVAAGFRRAQRTRVVADGRRRVVVGGRRCAVVGMQAQRRREGDVQRLASRVDGTAKSDCRSDALQREQIGKRACEQRTSPPMLAAGQSPHEKRLIRPRGASPCVRLSRNLGPRFAFSCLAVTLGRVHRGFEDVGAGADHQRRRADDQRVEAGDDAVVLVVVGQR